MKFKYLIIDEDGTVTGSDESQEKIESYVSDCEGSVAVVDVETSELLTWEGEVEVGRTEIEEADLEVEGEED